MNKQISMSALSDELQQVRTKKKEFLEQIDHIIPWGIGGWNGFVASVYLAGPGPVLYHLYDDRGLDVLGGSRELLLPLYRQFHDWVLGYDMERIDRLFAPAEE